MSNGFFSSANSWIQQNPETFAMALDIAGQGFDRENPFAGVGTSLAQSSLAAKAEEKDKTSNRAILDKLLNSLTEGSKPGGNKVSFKMGPDGRLVANIDTTIDTSALRLDEVRKPTENFSVRDYLKQLAVE